MKKEFLKNVFRAALAAVEPGSAVKRSLTIEDGQMRAGQEQFDLAGFDRMLVVGAGKAAARMAAAAEEVLGDRISGGMIVVPYGSAGFLQLIDQVEASHPVPDAAGMEATARVLDLVQAAGERTLVICLLSGGASALLVQPMAGIPLEDKQRTTELLLRAGTSIREMNMVRKHLSRIKGGWLAQTAYPATVLGLVLSDVIGNPLDVIGSGPTAPDPTTYHDAAAVLRNYGLEGDVPWSVRNWIELGVKGQEAETPKSGQACFQRTTNVIIGGIEQALSAARARAESLGMAPEIVTAELQGEARAAGGLLAQRAREARRSLKRGEARCFLSGGETTVTVRGQGTGGRNQELALAFAVQAEGVPGVTLLSAGTDGIDGPTEAAGAIVDGDTAGRARTSGLDPATYLDRNDSYSFFRALDGAAGTDSLLVTGPTGTNVMDLQILCVEDKDDRG